MRETDLYAPIKAHLEAQGFDVKAEVGAVDVVALRAGDDPLIVELKTGFSLILLQQAVARQAISDCVYVAVPRWAGKSGWRTFKGNVGLCKRLGIGVISVRLKDGHVQVHAEPGVFRPRKSKLRKTRMLREFIQRDGDPNLGGTQGSVVTAYRQGAVKCAQYLGDNGASKGAVVAGATGVAKATRMMADNHYGWFVRVTLGIYDLTGTGHTALEAEASDAP